MSIIESFLERVNDDAVRWDGCDKAIVGFGSRPGWGNVLVYDYDLLLNVFIGEGMTEEEAAEWVDYNIIDAWVGDGTPIMLYTK